jgi:type I restriction enzyme S subunit
LGGALCGIDAGASPDLPGEPAGPGEWGVLKVSAIRPAGLREDENKAVTDGSLIDPALEVADGDVLMSRANTAQLVGLACFVRNPRRGLMLSDKTLRLRPDRRRVAAEFLSQLLQTPAARRQLETSGTGSSGSMKNISQAEICSLVLPFPDLAEQQRILDVTAAARETALAHARRLAKLRATRRGLTDDLLAGRVRVAEAGDASPE